MFSCKHCNIQFENKRKLAGHSTWCDSNPNKKKNLEQLRANSSTAKKVLCEKCSFEIQGHFYKSHFEKCDGRGPWRKRGPAEGKCRFCNESFGSKLCSHTPLCFQNPKRNQNLDNRKKASTGRRGSPLSEEHKEKLSRRIQEKVQEGTWHLSFSKSRTHEYKGIKLHGMWEVKYAKFLDEQGIKWRRPTEKFKYSFEGKDSYYTPDFFLIEQNLYIEIKGYKVLRDEAKWSQFPLNLKVITGKDLIELGLLENKDVKDIPI
jgi:hypothetical protein